MAKVSKLKFPVSGEISVNDVTAIRKGREKVAKSAINFGKDSVGAGSGRSSAMDGAESLTKEWVDALDRQEIGKMLKAARKRTPLTQDDVGAEMGRILGTQAVARSTIARMESGELGSSNERLDAFLRAVGQKLIISMTYLDPEEKSAHYPENRKI